MSVLTVVDIVFCENSLLDIHEAVNAYFWSNFCGRHHKMPSFSKKIQPVLEHSCTEHLNCHPCLFRYEVSLNLSGWSLSSCDYIYFNFQRGRSVFHGLLKGKDDQSILKPDILGQ